MPVLKANPTVEAAANAWTRGFAAAVRDAAGNNRLTPAKAADMSGPYADNAQNYFVHTGRQSSSADTVIDSGARYVRGKLEEVAGTNGKLSLAEIRRLPTDLVDDLLILRGKSPAVAPAPVGLDGLKDAIKATDLPEFNDYNKGFDIATYPASKSKQDVLRDIIGYDQLTDGEANDWFESTKGAAGVSSWASIIRDIGKEERDNADADPGSIAPAALEKLYTDIAAGAESTFLPASQFKSVELLDHTIAEDGDTELRLLLAKKKDNSWMVLRYTNFPF